MSAFLSESKRQVVPRWLPFQHAQQLGQHLSHGESTVLQLLRHSKIEDLEDLRERWAAGDHGTSNAVDLICTSLMLGMEDHPLVIEAAGILLSGVAVTPFQQNLAKMVLLQDEIQEVNTAYRDLTSRTRNRIAHLKSHLSMYQQNAISWMDMAFYYTLLGQTAHAERCTRVALALGPNNRFILRSSARFWMHRHRPDIALHTLRSSQLVLSDPWIVCADIAVADRLHKPPLSIRRARSMLDNSSFSPFSLSELAASIATIEAHAGTRRKSLKFARQALVNPTENALAQVEYITKLNNIDIAIQDTQALAPFEARTRFHYRMSNFGEALNYAIEWCNFQPFESRAAVFATYLASAYMNDHVTAIDIAKRALTSSPKSFPIVNNLIYALACQGQLTEALSYLPRARALATEQHSQAVLTATLGAIAFRMGKVADGRAYYDLAISEFKSMKDARSEAFAYYFWSREELRLSAEKASRLYGRAKEQLEASGTSDVLPS